nr:two-component system sensor histidine kinase/response regulator, putative [Tanacetum cinerariifolium]
MPSNKIFRGEDAIKVYLSDDRNKIPVLFQAELFVGSVKEGYLTAAASDGRQALAVAQDFVPDIILLDVMMPQLDGIATCRLLREQPRLKDTYIMILTARSEEFSEVAAFDAGADDFIAKPIKPRALLSRLAAVVRRDQDPHAGVEA